MQVRKGKRGPFLGCSNYPNCKNIMPMSLGFKCPKPDCEGEIVQQLSKRGKMFYACNKEGCDFISWTRPVEGECPDCGAKFLIKKGDKLVCPNPDCGHARED
ncbi:MAG: DNA topoisomerase 1 [Deltaproteobacteria bacterium ADurb.Bin510]|nr:MAG: DNA topoisomerase 1 [Deltaproteobacteria bacterium ADurb.Bin510]